jgi:hypothetical protein
MGAVVLEVEWRDELGQRRTWSTERIGAIKMKAIRMMKTTSIIGVRWNDGISS